MLFLCMQKEADLAKENKELRAEISYLKQELEQFKRLIFGSRKERFIPSDPGQQELFRQQVKEPPKEEEEISYTRKKGKNKGAAKRLQLPAHLPRQEEIINPEDTDEQSEQIGQKVSEVLEYTPGKFYVHKTIRPVYKQKSGMIKVAPLPSQVIPSGNAGASLLAYLMVSKYMDHLPFYRQVQIFKRDGVKLPESTISGWFKKVCELMAPLYEEMVKQVDRTDYIQADESPLPVLCNQKPGATHKGYQWVFLMPKTKMVVFRYDKSRSREVPLKMLKNFRGCLQTDGYKGYDEISRRKDIIHIGCMAHARRKFYEVKDNYPEQAEHALNIFQQLYQLEEQARKEQLDADQLRLRREEKASPLLKELKLWLIEQAKEALPKSGLGKAINYTLTQWERLIKYTENGEWMIDNNWVENKIRPLALGRKNYLFAGGRHPDHNRPHNRLL
jgi:transposase